MQKKLFFLKILIVALILVIVALAIFWQPKFNQTQTQTQNNQTQNLAYDFTLQNVKGNINLSDLTLKQNKYVLLYFGYTYCPDICPTSLLTLAEALNSLPQNIRNNFQLLFVSVDPQRDNLQHLQEYGEFFYKNILTATSFDDKNLQQIANNYKVIYRKHFDQNSQNSQNYSIDHTANVILISPENKRIWTFQHGTSAAKIAEVLKSYF